MNYINTFCTAITVIIALAAVFSPIIVACINAKTKRIELVGSKKLEAYSVWSHHAALLINSPAGAYSNMFFTLLQQTQAAAILANPPTYEAICRFTRYCRRSASAENQEALLSLYDDVIHNMNADVVSTLSKL